MMEVEAKAQEEQEASELLEQMAMIGAMLGVDVPIVGSPPAGAQRQPAGSAARGKVWEPDLRYRSLVERLPVVTFMASLDESVQELYISPQIEALLGFTQEEWLENPILWFRQLHPDDREKWLNEFAQTCVTGAHFRAEYRLFARDGRVVWVQGECQLIRDEQGRPAFLQGIAFDITHLKQAAVVEEAKLAAETANIAKSEFLARMSHEIRTPLNGVVGMIDLLSGTGLNEGQQRYARLARESAESLMRVINEILDFSKVEAGKVELESVEFDFYKVVEDLTELLAPVASKKHLELACFLRPDVPRYLIGDPNRIRQVITNLVGNALKFTTAGQVSIRATLHAKDAGGVTLRIEVEDTGMGIPADRLDRLFKSFSQVDSSTTRKFGGTGLGLAISKRLVELMGGQIAIRSEVGKGTTFWFTVKLPVAAASEAPPILGAAEALRQVRVIAVESDPLLRRILSEQLDGRLLPSSAVLSTEDSILAMRRAKSEGKPFAVALLPYGTDETVALVSAIRSDPDLRDIKLVAIVKIDDQRDSAELSQAGFQARLQRPLTQSRLIDVIADSTVQRSVGKPLLPPISAAEHRSLQGLHLLVAEDNEMNQFVTGETLGRAGCTCEIVSDGAAAVEAVQRGKYDGVLMDCQMPGMDGLEATRRIRQWESAATGTPRLPIIALTAEAIHGDREKCLAAGMDGYVTKPINPKELFAAIGTLVPSPARPAAGNGSAAARPDPKPSEGRIAPASPPAAAPAPAPVAPLSVGSGSKVPINVESLFNRCMRDAKFACNTLEKFHQRALGDLDRLRHGAAGADVEGVRRLAHNLKAVAGHVGAESLSRIAAQLEEAGARRDLAFIESEMAALDAEIKRCASFVPEALQQIVAAGGIALQASPSR